MRWLRRSKIGKPITIEHKNQKLRVSACGLFCERCPKLLKGHCSGCAPNPVCPLPECAKEKGVKICFDCDDFPCEKVYGFFPKEFLDFLKSDEIVG
ncbi:MAG: DUF3795 domain-containing protein [Candidatus Zixiibacteriota bacterium]